MKITSRVALACFVIAAIGCGGSGGTDPGYNGGGGGGGGGGTTCTPGGSTVCLVSSNSFSPATLTVTAGTSVSFNNVSGTTHNVTFTTAGAPASVTDFASGAKTVAFPTAGTYNYHCTIHGLSMSGVVVVQ